MQSAIAVQNDTVSFFVDTCPFLWGLFFVLILPVPPSSVGGAGEMSASCFLQWSMLTRSLMCISDPTSPLSSLSMTISPNVISLFQHVRSVFLFFVVFFIPLLMHWWKTCTSWSHWQLHSPCGSTIVPVSQCGFLMSNSQVLLFPLFPFLLFLSPRNEGAPTHSCHWPGRPHRET